MKTTRLSTLVLAAASIFAPVAIAHSAPPSVTSLNVQGSGCPDASRVTASLTDQGNGRFVYGLVLADLDAYTTLPGNDIVVEDCAVDVQVTPPPGYQLRIAAVMLQGRHDAPSETTTAAVISSYRMGFADGDSTPQMKFRIETNKPLPDYDLGGNMRITHADGVGTPLGNWTVAVETRDMHFSPCGEAVTLEGVLAALASSEDGVTEADQVVQRSDVTGSQGLAWGWEFQRCEDHQPHGFDGRWSSRYKALNGMMVNAQLDIHGESGSGTYRTSSFVGQLYNLETIDGELYGRWKALGSEGWIKFTLNHDGHTFSGIYGLGQDENQTWSWSGQR